MSTVRLQNTHVALRYFGAVSKTIVKTTSESYDSLQTYHSWEVVKDSEEFSAGTAHISKSGGDELQFTVNCAELLPSAQSCQVELIGKLGPSSHNPRVEILKSDDPNYLETAYLSDRSISNQYRYVPLSEWQGSAYYSLGIFSAATDGISRPSCTLSKPFLLHGLDRSQLYFCGYKHYRRLQHLG